jgi:hypothetical protein
MASVTVLLIAVGLYFHMNLYSVNRDIKKARAKFSKNYEIVMGKKLSETASSNTIIKNLNYELGKVENENDGIITAEASASSKLTLVLKAFIECAKQTSLKIKSIDITEKNIVISGDISSKTITLIDILKKTGLNVKSSNIQHEDRTNRDVFTLTLEPTS